ncbi:MAG: DUF3160 domain-containing protein [Chitinivibrionales bacterium]
MKFLQFCPVVALSLIGLFPMESSSIVTITQPIATSFGTYTPGSVSFTPSIAPYTVPNNLTGVLYADKYMFSDTAMALLAKNGFVAIPTNAQSMTAIYQSTVGNRLPVFVTTDAVLHTFYKTYDNMLKIAEYNRFYSELDSMLHCMLSGIVPLRAYTGNDSLKLAITHAAAYLDVAHTLLTDTITFANDSAVKAMVVAETSLVYQHQGFAQSNVVPSDTEDYSQYVPRGHYTLDAKFEHYFRSMMYLGRISMSINSRAATMQASVLTRLLATTATGADSAKALWANIYNPTTFFVGRSDDLNFLQYAGVFDQVLGNQWRTGDIGIFYTKLDTILTELRKLPLPLILSGLDGSPGFHMMGQRFVPDSYVFGQMVFSCVGTDADPRLFPSGLDMLAVLGSQRARQLQINTYHQDQFLNYTKQLDSLTTQFAAKPATQWVDNLYWNWLYTLVPLLQTCGQGYPFFMTSQAWTDKSLVSASGSWAELRHASVLYAKQSYTYATTVPCPDFICFPQGYVEPNPEVFGRLAAMVLFMKNGFDSAGISQILPITKLASLNALCLELRDIAIQELQGGNVTINQYSDIAGAYKILASVEDFSQYQVPPPAYSQSSGDSTIACIIDVHTDPNTSQVLEVGVGKPMCLYVVVPIEGKLQVCRGAMFSYYEFLHSMNDRMTDVEWNTMLASSKPAVPTWESEFSIGADQSIYKNYGEDLTTLVSTNDNIPESFLPGDSVVAVLQSDSTPTVTLESKGSSRLYIGSPVENGSYQVIIPSVALGDTNILTIDSYVKGAVSAYCLPPEVPISYRKLLVKTNHVAIAAAQQTAVAILHPRFQANRLFLPPGTAWRIVDMRGRQVAFINTGIRQWTPSPRLACMQLFLIPMNGLLQRPMRFIIGE